MIIIIISSHSDILQRRKWVESVKADHTHSLTQHRAAVELELKRLAECREQRFKAEDSRVKHLQDSVRNMSLLSNFSLDDEDDEIKNEVRQKLLLALISLSYLSLNPPPL